ncbi:hypothetical protein LPU83_1553 [Rhizobium favelukesii]|uniref:Uncharacterized protein n=1 Tax=Rhizobium favelukesii TaxID=348824 RepID=W6RA17_9HYPH|nr:hypothetical protein LPU83_1553 [Rhizobium favelukesii]
MQAPLSRGANVRGGRRQLHPSARMPAGFSIQVSSCRCVFRWLEIGAEYVAFWPFWDGSLVGHNLYLAWFREKELRIWVTWPDRLKHFGYRCVRCESIRLCWCGFLCSNPGGGRKRSYDNKSRGLVAHTIHANLLCGTAWILSHLRLRKRRHARCSTYSQGRI